MDRGEKTPDDLERPEGNSLKDNYQLHDVAEEEVVNRLVGHGYDVVQRGIDMRDDDGSEGLIYSDEMDFEIRWNGEPIALLDVKSKSSQKWMGWFNERHYESYYEWSEELDVPVFVAMFHVQTAPSGDDEEIELATDEFVFEIGRGGKYAHVKASSRDEEVRPFPDRNRAVFVPSDQRKDWDYLETRLEQQTIATASKNTE